LLEGMPGLAKTHAVNALAGCINAKFRRLQFTPDLLPADLLGTMIFHPHSGEFKPRLGPIFANLVLADEINRAPAKVQSALLEAMQERQVTIGEVSHRLPDPFLVLATMNPIEQEGTYALPEAQLDRFLLKIHVPYPDRGEERRILDMMATTETPSAPPPIVGLDAIAASRRLCNAIHISGPVRDYIVDLVHATRDPGQLDSGLKHLTRAGASPRATLNLARSARARAFLDGRDFVGPDDVRAMAPEILRHRILLSFEAEAEGVSTDDVIARLLHKLPIP
jgi:MoxR-like ATPase